MTDYQLCIKTSAQKELDALGNPHFSRVDKKILELASDPRPSGSKKLKGYSGHWRIRIGNYRIIYIIDDANKSIDVTRIAHRRDVYR